MTGVDGGRVGCWLLLCALAETPTTLLRSNNKSVQADENRPAIFKKNLSMLAI